MEFNVADTGLGVLTPDQDFYSAIYSGMSFYYNPDDTLFYVSSSKSQAKKIGANLVPVCLEAVDVADNTPPSACEALQPVKRWLWAAYTDGSGGGWVGYQAEGIDGLKWSIPEVRPVPVFASALPDRSIRPTRGPFTPRSTHRQRVLTL